MNSSSWIQIIGYVIVVLGSGFSAYVAVRSAISRVETAVNGLQTLIEAETRRIEKLLEVQVGRLDQLIASGQREREEHNERIRFLEQRLMDEISTRRS